MSQGTPRIPGHPQKWEERHGMDSHSEPLKEPTLLASLILNFWLPEL